MCVCGGGGARFEVKVVETKVFTSDGTGMPRVGGRDVPRIFGGGGGERRGGGGGARSAKEANKPNKRATGLKPRTCAHQGSMC